MSAYGFVYPLKPSHPFRYAGPWCNAWPRAAVDRWAMQFSIFCASTFSRSAYRGSSFVSSPGCISVCSHVSRCFPGWPGSVHRLPPSYHSQRPHLPRFPHQITRAFPWGDPDLRYEWMFFLSSFSFVHFRAEKQVRAHVIQAFASDANVHSKGACLGCVDSHPLADHEIHVRFPTFGGFSPPFSASPLTISIARSSQ